MKILYDHQMFLKQKYGGITKYFCELMKHLPSSHRFELSVLLSENQHLKDDFKVFKKWNVSLPDNDFRGKGRIKTSLYNINRSYSRYRISRNDFDLLHPTYFDPYFLNLVTKPYIVTVHDLIVFKFKDVNRREQQMAAMSQIINKSKRIIAVSENTKTDLINILKVNPKKIDIVYHGFNKLNFKNNVNLYGRYILYVGARAGYKNFKTLAKAFQQLVIHDKDLKMICVGVPFSKSELEELEYMKILKNTIAMGVNEIKLNELYSHALTFVYPTKYEGFGMSILEAFANNCPVCLSDTSCLPEIAGEAGVYFDPTNPDSLAEAIKKTIYDSKLSKRMTEAGNRRLQNFSWVKCGQQTIDSYEKALS